MAATEFEHHGIIAKGLSLDLKVMMGRKDKVVSDLTQGVEFLMKKNKVDYVIGEGTIKAAGEVVITPPKKGAKREKFLLAVSDLYVQKNFKNLLSAMARLTPDHPDLTLKIAGRPIDEDYFAELKQVVAEEGLEGKVEFLGGVPPRELAELYRRCGVFVFPSTVETFGNPLVEAMASGAPMACSNTAAMPEVVGDAAEFLSPEDVGNMASAIDHLLKNAKLRRELSLKGVKRAKAFSWQRTAEKTLAVIKDAAVS